MPAMTKAAPARAAFETRSRGNGSPISALSKEHMLNSIKSSGEGNPPAHRGFAEGQRVISTSPHGTAGLAGTVAEVKYAEPFHGGGDTGRLIVTVELDGGERTVFLADGREPIYLKRVPDRIHPGWSRVTVADLATMSGLWQQRLVLNVLDDMTASPRDVAADLRAVADVLDRGTR